MDHLIQKVNEDEMKLAAINAAIPGLFGLKAFQAAHPGHYFDVGIAEGHSITFAAGLASQGVKPVVFHSSTFLQRAYDQLSHDLAINELPAVLIIGGGTTSSGAVTHLGLFDIPLINTIPELQLSCADQQGRIGCDAGLGAATGKRTNCNPIAEWPGRFQTKYS